MYCPESDAVDERLRSERRGRVLLDLSDIQCSDRSTVSHGSAGKGKELLIIELNIYCSRFCITYNLIAYVSSKKRLPPFFFLLFSVELSSINTEHLINFEFDTSLQLRLLLPWNRHS